MKSYSTAKTDQSLSVRLINEGNDRTLQVVYELLLAVVEDEMPIEDLIQLFGHVEYHAIESVIAETLWFIWV